MNDTNTPTPTPTQWEGLNAPTHGAQMNLQNIVQPPMEHHHGTIRRHSHLNLSSTLSTVHSTTALQTSQTPPVIEHDIPYVSVDGRRKRRRTTLEDAFDMALSMNDDEQKCGMDGRGEEHEHELSAGFSCRTDDILTPTKDGDVGHAHGQWDACRNEMAEYDMEGMEHVPKRLDYSHCGSGAVDRMRQEGNGGTRSSSSQQTTMNENYISSMLSSYSSSSLSNDSSISMSMSDPIHMDPTIDGSDHNGTIGSDSSHSYSQTDTDHDGGPLSVLFAPRKNKKHINQYLDPVDERIEELIRHSRIRAVVVTNREMARQKQKRRAYERCKHQQTGEKDKDASVGVGNILRRKNVNDRQDNGGGGHDSSNGINGSLGGGSRDDLFLKQGHDRQSLLSCRTMVDGANFGSTDSGSNSGKDSVGTTGSDSSSHSRRSTSVPRAMKYNASMEMDSTMME